MGLFGCDEERYHSQQNLEVSNCYFSMLLATFILAQMQFNKYIESIQSATWIAKVEFK